MKLQVRLTSNFKRNLVELESFLLETGAINLFDELLSELLDTVIPNLERFPDLGRPFFNQPIKSVEAANGIQKLIHKSKNIAPESGLREYLLADDLLLYLRRDEEIYLLSIRHHRQLSFDYHSLWSSEH